MKPVCTCESRGYTCLYCLLTSGDRYDNNGDTAAEAAECDQENVLCTSDKEKPYQP